MKPIEKELSELQEKIDNMKHVERITRDLQDLKKKLAWSWVYTVDRDIQKQAADIEKRRSRIPKIQDKIDSKLVRTFGDLVLCNFLYSMEFLFLQRKKMFLLYN